MAAIEMKAVLACVQAAASYLSLLDHESDLTPVSSIIIANFEFAPAYVGQKTLPTAAVTMSTFLSRLSREAS